jgi:hypothetical protein
LAIMDILNTQKKENIYDWGHKSFSSNTYI